ncbi:MAG: DUF4153 domain-containing protein [Eubacteriales bacterium]|nr:DUF4153 domain-containing protein [Eubacteriales bacterium]
MNTFAKSIQKVFQGVMNSFKAFPETIICALAFSIVTMVRIQLDWPEQEAYNFLLNTLHWSFALGAIFSLATTTAIHARFHKPKSLLYGYLLGVAAVVITFGLLYLFGRPDPALAASRVISVSQIAAARVTAVMVVSFVAFIILAAYPKDKSDFARSFFMTHKAFFIALIYGAVIMGGTSGVAGAVQALLYEDMSSKVYMYLGTLVGFLTFTIFVGYFPDFQKGELDEHREVAEKQPRFIEVLLGYIMIPILLALTAVLLLWTAKTTLTGQGASFMLLSGIATSYAAVGIWLHIMVTNYETGIAKFYRRVYPFAALLILGFEAWALVVQLNKYGLKTAEYFFALLWILAVAAAVLLIIKQAQAHKMIAYIFCVLAIVSVLPVIGHHVFPVAAQIDRVEGILIEEGMLKDGELSAAKKEPSLQTREAITDAVLYLAYQQTKKLPSWFDPNMTDNYTFTKKFGFEQAWPESEDMGVSDPGSNIGISLRLPPEVIEISGYRWAANLSDFEEKGRARVVIDGERGSYEVNWSINTPDGIPVLLVTLDDRVILEEDMNSYIDKITAKYPPGEKNVPVGELEDMTMKLETAEISVLLVFSNVDINVNTKQDEFYYWLSLSALYMNEKTE